MNDELHNIKIDTIHKFKVPCFVYTQSQTETMAVGRPSMNDAGTSIICFPFVSGLCSELNYAMPKAIAVLY